MPLNPDNSLRPFTSDEVAAMGIETFEVREGAHPTETRRVGDNTMQRAYLVNWESRYDFVALVCGDETQYTNEATGTLQISRLLPDPTYGATPYLPEIVATRIDRMVGSGSAGIDDSFGLPGYDKARVDVFLEHVPYELYTDAQLATMGGSEFLRYTYYDRARSGTEVFTLPGGSMKFWTEAGGTTPPNGIPVPYNIGLVRASEEFSYNWVRLPYECFKPGSVLYDRVYGTVEGDIPFLGCVNSAVFANRPIGTVLFSGVEPRLERSHTATGWRWSLKYSFAFSATGWTWLYYPDPSGVNAGWSMVSNKGFHYADELSDGESIVPGARDLNLLWQVS